jgi:endonuclease/exonuclease/phosphatase family metal-dependent hydrolase
MMRWLKPALCLALTCLFAGCRTGRDYLDPAGPRHAGAALADARVRGDTIHVVCFNIEFAKEMTRAIHVLKTHPDLRDADVILLQEMDVPGAKMAADSLRMHYVYYPAVYNKLAATDIGNAVLSRWPITADAKLILPRRSRYAKTQRIATAATIQFNGRAVRVYSTHLGTPLDVGSSARAEQLRFILDDAAKYDLAILGGDMNSKDVGKVAQQAGYLWPTQSIPKSNSFGRLDHIFLKGLQLAGERAAGTASISRSISDHRPIWLKAVVR